MTVLLTNCLCREGWYSRVWLAEHRVTREEVVLKAMNANQVTAEDFSREYQSSLELAGHTNILRVFDGVFQCEGYFLFATEYAPLGDLTSNIQDGKEGSGLSETNTKRVTQQVSQGELSVSPVFVSSLI